MGMLLENVDKEVDCGESKFFEGEKQIDKEINGNNCVIMVSVEEIMPNKGQPRRIFDISAFTELAESIEKYGVIQPIAVRKCEETVGSVFKYELIAGERRLRASKMAGLSEIPCVLMDVNEEKSAELAIIENLHRKDLNIFETAEAISSLIEVYGLTQEEIASKLSVTQSAVANKLRLLRLSEDERRVIIGNNLTERHARGLLKISDPDVRMRVLERIADKNMNVKAAEEYVECVLDGVEDENRIIPAVSESERMKRYINLIQKTVERLRRVGCGAKSTCTETDDFYIYTITVDKK